MRFSKTELEGVHLLELERHADDRGSFARTFCEREFEAAGLPGRFPQCNLSANRRRGTLRGMHYEVQPTRENKLVRCSAGAIYDVVVDLRRTSPTYLGWFGAELTAENGSALFIPAGCAHGFLTLADATDVFYHMGDYYSPERARGFRWNDPRFPIAWPFAPVVVSERDASYPDFDPAAHALLPSE